MYPVVSFRNISKSFGLKKILSDISFDVMENEIFGLIGESGSGKTTLLRTLIGFYSPDKGNIYSLGQSLVENPDVLKERFGFSSQDGCFYQDLTPLENLKYFGKLYRLKGSTIKQMSEFLLKMVELWDSRSTVAGNLSGGMQRRLDLCCALLHKPKVLIMDEPTAGLDPLLRKHMWSIIKKINASGVTVIISSHLLNEMEQLCTNVAMIQNGKLIGRGTPDQLKNLFSKNEEIILETFPGGYKYIVNSLMEKGVQLNYVRYEKHNVVMYTPNAEAALKAIVSVLEELKEKLLEIEIHKPSLNEVFEALSRYYSKTQPEAGAQPQQIQQQPVARAIPVKITPLIPTQAKPVTQSVAPASRPAQTTSPTKPVQPVPKLSTKDRLKQLVEQRRQKQPKTEASKNSGVKL